MQNLITPTLLPTIIVKESLGIIDSLLNHSARIKEIDNNYAVAKKQMRYAYDAEVKRIENDMNMFKLQIKTYSKNSNNNHKERILILKQAHEITLKICEVKDMDICKMLNDQVIVLLNIYEKNNQQNIHFIENSMPLITK